MKHLGSTVLLSTTPEPKKKWQRLHCLNGNVSRDEFLVTVLPWGVLNQSPPDGEFP